MKRKRIVLCLLLTISAVLVGCKETPEPENSSSVAAEYAENVETPKQNEEIITEQSTEPELPLTPEQELPLETETEHDHMYLDGVCILCGEPKPADESPVSAANTELPRIPG